MKQCVIVVVDDEKEFEEYVETLLQRRGYDHVSFNDSRQALEFIGGHKESIDIVISDVRMPGIDGIELAKKAANIKEEISVILISGYAEELVAGVSLPNVKALLDKPVSKQDLLKAVETEIEKCVRRRRNRSADY